MSNKHAPDPLVYLPPEDAERFMILIMTHLVDWPLKTAESFRNAVLGNGAIAVNPLLGIENDNDVSFLKSSLKKVIAEGRMIDFGFIPNELYKTESLRSRRMFESGDFQHPYDTWLGIASWEGGSCGYYFTPHPADPSMILCIELYGVSVPQVGDAILIYDIISIEVKGIGQTLVHPAPMKHVQGYSTHFGQTEEEAGAARGANTLDPMVTMLRILADASIPIVDRPAPVKLNKHRVKKGLWEIPAHTAVLTKDYVTAFRAAQAGMHEKGTHASPVAHWRRAHKRTLADGRIVPVRSSKVNWRETEELHRLFYRVPEKK
jgi:hypothetical protein